MKANARCRILGVDPGSRRAGFGFLETCPGWGDVSWGVVAAAGDLPDRLATLAARFRTLARRLKPDVAAIEEAYYGKDVRSLLRMGEARGAILVALRDAGVPVVQFPPAVIKRAVTGNGNATKAQVAAMVERLVGRRAVGVAEDAADALAVAICCAHRTARERRWTKVQRAKIPGQRQRLFLRES